MTPSGIASHARDRAVDCESFRLRTECERFRAPAIRSRRSRFGCWPWKPPHGENGRVDQSRLVLASPMTSALGARHQTVRDMSSKAQGVGPDQLRASLRQARRDRTPGPPTELSRSESMRLNNSTCRLSNAPTDLARPPSSPGAALGCGPPRRCAAGDACRTGESYPSSQYRGAFPFSGRASRSTSRPAPRARRPAGPTALARRSRPRSRPRRRSPPAKADSRAQSSCSTSSSRP